MNRFRQISVWMGRLFAEVAAREARRAGWRALVDVGRILLDALKE